MLRFFKLISFDPSSQIGLNDYSFANGTTNTFNLTNNTFSQLANTAQFGASTFYKQSDGTLTGSGSTAITGTIPSNGLVGIFPNEVYGELAAYDQPTLIQTAEVIYFIGDIEDIEVNKYVAASGYTNIEVSFTNQIVSGGADPSWLSFAPLNAIDMSIGAYQSPGDPFLLDFDISGESTTQGTVQGLPFVVVYDPSEFAEGQFIKIGTGVSAFTAWITSISGTTLNLLETVDDVGPDTPVKVCGAAFAIKVDIPTDAAGGVLTNFVNCSLDAIFQIEVR